MNSEINYKLHETVTQFGANGVKEEVKVYVGETTSMTFPMFKALGGVKFMELLKVSDYAHRVRVSADFKEIRTIRAEPISR